MSHWAEIDDNNIVVRVLVGDNNDPNGDEGYQWFVENLGGRWIKTSYNAIGGKRRNPETNEITDDLGFRKNYAGIGYTWDEARDAFIPPKPYNSWVLNEDSCQWETPIPMPTEPAPEGKVYVWNESIINWELIDTLA